MCPASCRWTRFRLIGRRIAGIAIDYRRRFNRVSTCTNPGLCPSGDLFERASPRAFKCASVFCLVFCKYRNTGSLPALKRPTPFSTAIEIFRNLLPRASLLGSQYRDGSSSFSDRPAPSSPRRPRRTRRAFFCGSEPGSWRGRGRYRQWREQIGCLGVN